MVPMIIPMTQTMQDWSNEDVWPPFQSSSCTHNLMWWSYVLLSNTHLSKWWINTWPKGSQIISLHVTVCFLNFTIFERSHLDSIGFGSHHQTNLWQAQNNLVGMCECWKSHDYAWLHLTTKTLHIWIGNIRKVVDGMVAQKPCHFNLVLGFASFKTCILFSRS
jgi:hypothetical protein